MPFLLRETVSSHPPSPSLTSAAPPLDDLPGYQYNPMPLFSSQFQLTDNDTHEHSTTVPHSPYEAPIAGSHSPAPLEIVLPSDEIVFRGVGQDVESALLSGHLVLNLTEAINIREITLQLTGKVRIQVHDSSHARQGHHSHVFYTHDWSFLEGERNHKHTIKAGQHVFPFQVQLPNTLPVSCRTYPGSASVAYKLRATAVRSAFSANFHALRPLHIMRSFSPEAMEYNQTLEIENTWPGKIMYSFVVPHKAFAAGDDIPILVKFQPMAKGVSVQSIVTSVKEYTSIRWRGIQHQETRTVSTVRHVIRNGRAVPADQPTDTSSTTPLRSRSGSHMNVFNGHGRSGTNASASTNGDAIGNAISRLHAVSSGVAMAAGISSAAHSASVSASGSAEGHDTQPIASTSRLTDSPADETVDQEVGDEEVDTSLHIALPGTASPTSTIEPILSLYKVKFSVVISNLDGHTSELRCALPIHVMDPRLAEEVRLATNATHNLLFGSENVGESQNIDLPSYQAHVLDRIAVADVSQPTRTVSNPLSRTSSSANLAGMISPNGAHNHSNPGGYFSSRSGTTPVASIPNSPGPSVPLDTVDSELLLSLGAQPSGPSSSSNTPPESRRESRAGSRIHSRAGSRAGSRANSRANSPERGQHGHGGIDGHKLAGALHSNRSGFFHLPSGMKPFTPFTKTRNAFSSHHSGNHSHAHATTPGSTSGTHTPASFHVNGSGGHTPDEDATPSAAADPLTRVPDYSVASRGFLGGGVTPLSRDLPSYDQAQQQVTTSASTGDMASLVHASYEEHDELGTGPSDLQDRPDMGGRRSTSDLLFMRSGHAITQAT
ncbi:putative response to drug-like protein [Rhizoctonia solani 123E]|uniref:Putative response to drug-like protein n=1 Tax=Rhizoctonia solani 123E TaxID=1423351 RepID=A0A074SAE3_9AGAM|nr:putative response to drug-like protein [Rhizoctonia solani 123E]